MEYNPFTLAGKTILVTGASSGIGRATSVECSRLGAKLVLCARSAEGLEETLSLLEGDGHKVVPADLSSEDGIGELVCQCPVLDGLVLCAGKGLTLPFLFSSRDKFDELFAINFFSPAETLRLLVKGKKMAKESSVVFVASVGGNTAFVPGASVYGSSKAALVSTMKYCAKELAPKKIRVNCVNPGMTATRFIQRGTVTEEQFKEDMEKYPLKRYGVPEDIAYGIIYLLSGASSWVTGLELTIDGGISI